MFKVFRRSEDDDPAYRLKIDITNDFVQGLHMRGGGKKGSAVQGCASNKINK